MVKVHRKRGWALIVDDCEQLTCSS